MSLTVIFIYGIGIHCSGGSKEQRTLWRDTGAFRPLFLLPKCLYLNLPFIKLIISGDFFQLPPVPGKSHEFHQESSFAFEAQSWDKCVGEPVVLNRVFRQTDTGRLKAPQFTYVDILNSVCRYPQCNARWTAD
jgi:hypothetical protein